MTARAPSPELQQGSPAETPKRRKLLGFYVAALTLLGLVAAGALVYRPLKIRHSARIVCRKAELGSFSWDDGAFMGHFARCVDAASQGNPLAMDACVAMLVCQPGRLRKGMPDFYPPPAMREDFYSISARQPALFFAVLGSRTKQEARAALEIILDEASSAGRVRGVPVYFFSTSSSLVNRAQELSRSSNAEVNRLATAAHEFIRHRFAKELAEARNNSRAEGTQEGKADKGLWIKSEKRR
jgi:hypothetical protein